jgi:hypothetical protein
MRNVFEIVISSVISDFSPMQGGDGENHFVIAPHEIAIVDTKCFKLLHPAVLREHRVGGALEKRGEIHHALLAVIELEANLVTRHVASFFDAKIHGLLLDFTSYYFSFHGLVKHKNIGPFLQNLFCFGFHQFNKMSARRSAKRATIGRFAVTNRYNFAVRRNDFGHRFRTAVSSMNMYW